MTRNVTRHAWFIATALLCATAAACGPGTGDPAAHPEGTATGDPSATAADPTTSTAPPQASSSSGGAAGTLAAAPAVRPCRVGDLALAPILANGAAGHMGYDVIVTNTSGSRCRLPAGHPRYVATDAATGRIGTLPTTPATGAPATTVTIGPGARARSALLTINGYGGYDPDNPACAHPVVYRDVGVRLASGTLQLTGLVLDVKCGGVTAYDWASLP